MPRRRAIFVTTSFPRQDGDAAGHFVHAHAEQMISAGWDVEVIAGGPAPALQQASSPLVHWAGGGALFGWPGVAARLRESPARAFGVIPFARRVRKLVRERGPFDRAVAHFMLPSAWPLLSDVHCPLEVVAHGGDIRLLLSLPSPLRNRVIDRLTRRDTQLFFVSTELRRRVLDSLPVLLASRLKDCSAVRPPAVGLPTAEMRAAAAAPWLQNTQEPYAVLAGRMVQSKRFALGLKAAAEAKLPTLVIGDGPQREPLQQLASNLTPKSRFLGRLSRVETLGLIERATVLLHPSAAEAAPTVVLEARALGVPVVACEAGDLAHWAKTDEGLHIAVAHPTALARGVRHATTP